MTMPNAQEENPLPRGFSNFATSDTTAMSQPQIPSSTVFGSTMSSQLQSSAKSPFSFSSSMASFPNAQNMSSTSPFQTTSPFVSTPTPSSGVSTPLFAKLPPVLPGMSQPGMSTPVFDFNTIRSVEEALEDQDNERVLAIDKAAAEQEEAEVVLRKNRMGKRAAARARAANKGLDFLAGVLDNLDLVKPPEEMKRERARIIREDIEEKKALRKEMNSEKKAAEKAAKAGLDAEEAAEMAFSLLSLDPQRDRPVVTSKQQQRQELREQERQQRQAHRDPRITQLRAVHDEIESFPAIYPHKKIHDMEGLDLIRALLLRHVPTPSDDNRYLGSVLCFKRARLEETVDGRKITLEDVLAALLPSLKENYSNFVACAGMDPGDMTEDQRYMYTTTTSRISIVRKIDIKRANGRQRAAASRGQKATTQNGDTAQKKKIPKGPKGNLSSQPSKKTKKGKKAKVETTVLSLPKTRTRKQRRRILKQAHNAAKKDNASGGEAGAGAEIDTSMDVDVVGKMITE